MNDEMRKKMIALVEATAQYVSPDWPPGKIRGLDIADMFVTYGRQALTGHGCIGVEPKAAMKIFESFLTLDPQEMEIAMKVLFPKGLNF